MATLPSVVFPVVLVKYARSGTAIAEVVAMANGFVSVPVVVIVPPERPSPVATEETVALEVLHVEHETAPAAHTRGELKVVVAA